jgi:hypothetical protein
MTLIDDQAAAHADARQAAYFRAKLNAERQLLQVEIGKRRALIDRPSDAARRQRSSLNSAEAELRYLNSLIARLDSRFAAGEDTAPNR